MHVAINKYFLLNSEKNGADPFCRFQEKRKKDAIPKNNVTEPKAIG